MQRRNLLIWVSVFLLNFILLSTYLLSKVLKYIVGPKLTFEQEAKFIENRIKNLEKNVYFENLRKERLLKDKLLVCDMKDLKRREGLQFVDFNLKPALAFLGEDGKPVLISSVCTHLGCTLQNKLKKGKLFCPCHISYFDVCSGQALEGPAKAPLPMIPYIVEDEKVFIVKNV